MLDDITQRTKLTDHEWILGNPDAEVTLLEYGDFECPYCAEARPVLEGLVKDYPGNVRLVFRHFPITSTHPHAEMAAEVAEAAGAQGKFWEMYDMIYTHQEHMDFEDLRGYAQDIGLDMQQFDDAMKGRIYQKEVKKDFKDGIQDGVNGTPTIFINRQRYDGPREREAMLEAISELTPVDLE